MDLKTPVQLAHFRLDTLNSNIGLHACTCPCIVQFHGRENCVGSAGSAAGIWEAHTHKHTHLKTWCQAQGAASALPACLLCAFEHWKSEGYHAQTTQLPLQVPSGTLRVGHLTSHALQHHACMPAT